MRARQRQPVILLLALVGAFPRHVTAQDPTCSEIGLPATCHSCLHAVAGPFGDVNAQAHDASFVFTAVDQPHTYYRVTLMAATTEGPFAGAALYYPNSDAPTAIAFYRASHYTVRVFADQGAEVLPLGAFATDPNIDCASIGYPAMFQCGQLLPYADVFMLDAVQHTVRFEGATQATIGVVIENLGSIGGSYYPDADHDDHGAYEPSLNTWCAPPDGYLDDSSDCDDANADVHDGATETCNRIDDDCDGLVDELDCAVADAAVSDGDAGSEPVVDAGIDAREEDSGAAVLDASMLVDAGDGGDAAADAGVSDSGEDARAPQRAPDSAGCSCNVVASTGSAGPGVLHAFGLLTFGTWRRRRRQRRETRA